MTSNHPVTVSQVIHPATGKVLAFEIVANDGQVYFVAAPGDFFEGLRVGSYPPTFSMLRKFPGGGLERVVIGELAPAGDAT